MIKKQLMSIGAALCGLISLSATAAAQPFWSQYGGNAQHTAESTNGVQTMAHILWSTPVDKMPPYSGTDLLLHYGSPLIGQGGTVVVTVRTGPNNTWPAPTNTYQLEGHDPMTGSTTWTQTTDWINPSHNWVPSCGSAIGPGNRVYTPGAGGTVYVRSSADSGAASVTQIAFYGIANYNANKTTYNTDVQICTPITVDSSDNIYFGFYVNSGSTTGLTSGIAKITSAGVGTWVSADAASGQTGTKVPWNCTPAVSNDGLYVYEVVRDVSDYNGRKLLRLNTSNLSTASMIDLLNGNPGIAAGGTAQSWVLDDGTASPMVGPDGDVYIGVWYNVLSSRGFMLHYSGDLSTSKPAGAFGWDDTASVVPASAVPSYAGTSSYLILSKYNNYADTNGDGLNKVGILDPNNTENYTVQYQSSTGPTYVVMKEVITALGPTPNSGLPGVREWCINMAAIDVAGKAAIVNSEDGHCYRWDFTTNTLIDNMNLAPPTGEAYTPTIVSSDGLAFAVNNAALFCLWDGARPNAVTLASSTVASGNATTATVSLKDDVSGSTTNATGPGAALTLTSSDVRVGVPASVTVAAGSSVSSSFPVTTTLSDLDYTSTITATRYGRSSSSILTVQGSGMTSLSLNQGVIYNGQTATATVTLRHGAPTAGRVVTLSADNAAISFANPTLNYASGVSSNSSTFTTAPLASSVVVHITATLDDSTTLTQSITDHAPLLVNLILNPNSLASGATSAITVATQGGTPAGGVPISMTYSAHTSGPATITAGTNNRGTGTLTTTSVASPVTETVSASFEGVTKTAQITISPPGSLAGFTVSSNSVYETDAVYGTVTLSSPAGSTVTFTATASTTGNPPIAYIVFVTQPTIASGQTSGTFKMRARILPQGSATPINTVVTVSNGTLSYTQTITDNPIFFAGFSVSPITLHSNNTATGTITLTQPAGDFALPVRIYCPDSNVSIPAYAYAPAGSLTAVFTITVGTVTTPHNANIYAYLSGQSRTQILHLYP